jgi:type I restriction-modification system DNA methylase subunit
MNKGYDLHIGKETWKRLEEIHRFGYSYSTIFSDFIDTCLFSLLSLTENMQHLDVIERLTANKFTGTYEEQYMQMVERYNENKTAEKGNRPIDYIAKAWGSLIKETMHSQEDVLGEIFTAKISFGEHGQFFTPFQITDMVTKLLYSEERRPGQLVSDPACGSGRFFISFSKLNKDARFYGVDLSPICVKMTALNMWLYDLDADIYHGNTLTMHMFHLWKVRKGGFIYEAEVKDEVPPLPKPVITKIREQAKQQKLFDFDKANDIGKEVIKNKSSKD